MGQEKSLPDLRREQKFQPKGLTFSTKEYILRYPTTISGTKLEYGSDILIKSIQPLPPGPRSQIWTTVCVAESPANRPPGFPWEEEPGDESD